MSVTEAAAQQPPRPSSVAMIRTLGIVALVSGLSMVFVYQITKPIIEANRQAALERAVFNVVPNAAKRTSFALLPEGPERLGPNEEAPPQTPVAYAVYNEQGGLEGFALEASAMGYQDVIRGLYGYSPEKDCIVGYTVIESKETPGLGDKIETDPEFLANFDCLDASLNEDGTALAHPIKTVKAGTKEEPWQIDAIAGATISCEAVGRMLNESAQKWVPYLNQHLDELKANPDG